MVWSLSCFPTCRSPVLARAAGLGRTRRRVGVELAVNASSSDRFRHMALLYHGHGEYLAGLRGFIQASRARGDAVFAAVPMRKVQLIRREVGEDSMLLRAPDDSPDVIAFPGPPTRIQRRARLAGLINEYQQTA